MFESKEIAKLTTVKEEILSQINNLGGGLQKKREEVLSTRKEMWREARIVLRDFDDVADLSIFAEEVARTEQQYQEASKQIIRLKKSLYEPYFARIDFTEEGYTDTEEIYIGRYSLLNESTGVFHVYDWRAPISSLYYDFAVGKAEFAVPGTGGTVKGDVTLKRQYQIERGNLKYLFDNDIAIEDKILQQELSKSADASIKIIVNTIQKDQNKAIRAEKGTVLVHGPAGSGKTSVGLHRLAYLLYRDRKNLTSAKVRIFSPSPIFESYIQGIIPALGEDDVENLNFAELLKTLAKEHRRFDSLYNQLEKASGERAEWINHKYSPAFLADLENFVQNYNPSFEDVTFNTDKLVGAEKLTELYKDRTSASTKKIKTDRVLSYVDRVYAEYFKAYQRDITELFNAIYQDNLSDHEIRIKFEEEKNIVTRDLRNRLNPRSSWLLERFLKAYAKKVKISFSFAREALRADKLFYEDALLLFYIDILTGKVAPDKTVKHILIDEAQDLSYLHHFIIKKLYPSCDFTVLADANQALFPGINLDSIDDLKKLYPQAEEITLTKSYRSTFEINNFAAQFLKEPNRDASYTRHGLEPEVIACKDATAAAMDILPTLPDSFNTVGILLPTTTQAREFYNRLKKRYPKGNTPRPLKLIDNEDADFTPGVMVMAVPFAKGLEFDAVICPSYKGEALYSDLEKRFMYLICTRALHRLYLLEGN